MTGSILCGKQEVQEYGKFTSMEYSTTSWMIVSKKEHGLYVFTETFYRISVYH